MTSFWPDDDVAGYQRRASYWTAAAVCRRGHVLSRSIHIDKAVPDATKCTTCGADVVTSCGVCGRRIRGTRFTFGVIASHSGWTPPGFCDGCGAAHPWATWEQRVWALENMLEDEDLDEATRLRITTLLGEIGRDGATFEPETEQRIWGRVKDLWPGLTEKAWTIAGPLITAEAKRKLGLPPA